MFCSHEGCSTCQLCPMGQFALGLGNANCTLCPPGTFKSIAGIGACRECLPGTYTLANATGSLFCQTCPSGYFCQCPICQPEKCPIQSQCPPGTPRYVDCHSPFLQHSNDPLSGKCDLSILSIILICIGVGIVAFPILLFGLCYAKKFLYLRYRPLDPFENTSETEYNPILMAAKSKDHKRFGAL